MSGDGSGRKSPVSIGVQRAFYEGSPKSTIKEEMEEDAVVAGLHRNNGSMKGGK
jgi:hypothetical protein